MGLLSRAVKHMGLGGMGVGAGVGAAFPELVDPGRDPEHQYATVIAAALLGGLKGKALQGALRGQIGKRIMSDADRVIASDLSEAAQAEALQNLRRRALDFGAKETANDLDFNVADFRFLRGAK